jgi:putative oxidoreductase
MSLAWALVFIRGVAGLTLAAHGAQKLFGWFGGPGYAKLEDGFGRLGLQPAWFWAALAILGELGGGLSLTFGFLTPLGAAGAVGAMVMAGSTHWAYGFFATKGGFEYPLALVAMSAGIGLAGPGAYSLDHLFRLALPQVPLFLALTLAALIVDAVGIAIKRGAQTNAALAARSHPA